VPTPRPSSWAAHWSAAVWTIAREGWVRPQQPATPPAAAGLALRVRTRPPRRIPLAVTLARPRRPRPRQRAPPTLLAAMTPSAGWRLPLRQRWPRRAPRRRCRQTRLQRFPARPPRPQWPRRPPRRVTPLAHPPIRLALAALRPPSRQHRQQQQQQQHPRRRRWRRRTPSIRLRRRRLRESRPRALMRRLTAARRPGLCRTSWLAATIPMRASPRLHAMRTWSRV
jgi:hypothetical protein